MSGMETAQRDALVKDMPDEQMFLLGPGGLLQSISSLAALSGMDEKIVALAVIANEVQLLRAAIQGDDGLTQVLGGLESTLDTHLGAIAAHTDPDPD